MSESSRMQTDEEIDVETLAKLLDDALSSNNPAVKDQLRKLLMVAALTSSNDPLEKGLGPFEKMASDIRVLKSQVRDIQEMSRGSRYNSEYELKKAMLTGSLNPTNFYDTNIAEILKKIK